MHEIMMIIPKDLDPVVYNLICTKASIICHLFSSFSPIWGGSKLRKNIYVVIGGVYTSESEVYAQKSYKR